MRVTIIFYCLKLAQQYPIFDSLKKWLKHMFYGNVEQTERRTAAIYKYTWIREV